MKDKHQKSSKRRESQGPVEKKHLAAEILLPMNFYWTLDMFFSAQTGARSKEAVPRAR